MAGDGGRGQTCRSMSTVSCEVSPLVRVTFWKPPEGSESSVLDLSGFMRTCSLTMLAS